MIENNIVRFMVEQQNRLSCIIRYNNTPKISDESVAEHSYYVATIAMLVADYLKFEKAISVDHAEVLKMSLLHDVEEIISGDIIKILKTAGLKAELDKLNEHSMRYLTGILGGKQGSYYYGLWSKAKDRDGIEAKIVELADWVAAIIYSIKEAHLGNKYFEEILEYAVKSFQIFKQTFPEVAGVIDAITEYANQFLEHDQAIINSINKAVRIDTHSKEEE